MNEVRQLSEAVSNEDPIIALRAVFSLRRLLDSIEAVQVVSARDQQWSWQQIADAMGVTKQAAHKKHANRRPPPPVKAQLPKAQRRGAGEPGQTRRRDQTR